VREVSKLCGVPIAHYVEIDFEGVIDLVDTLGGVLVNVPVYIDLDGVILYPGEQVLNGQQALIMSRCRNFADGDLTRIKNQRILVQAVAREVLASPLNEIPGLVEQLAGCIATDVDSAFAVDLVLALRGMDAQDMNMSTVPTYYNSHDGVSYLGVKQEEFAQMLELFTSGQEMPEASAPTE